ncbi:hypothetical protein B0H17DRAFT_1164209 [Mycena rosella]|uniref:Prefoldin subunit 2 n=1 Tax=Mycena rosella TaxID=1033263 RepID=A0AAD7BWK8_MYCRO|nr:hypothetical protein B0H17DRAFT_1164209 [Mycena rosella]
MSSSVSKAKSKNRSLESSQPEISQTYSRMQNELQALAGKIGELDQEADEHRARSKCFRLIGGVLVERTVKDVVPALQTTEMEYAFLWIFIKKVVGNLTEQYKTKEEEFDAFKRDYNIRPAARA